ASNSAPNSMPATAANKHVAPGATYKSTAQVVHSRDTAGAAAGFEANATKKAASLDSASHDAFMQQLHTAIDAHKRYPTMARRQRREGTATVLFRLHPDGALDALEMDNSSGFEALDEAALRAVAAVAPFGPAQGFLARETRFRVGVKFHLQ
ncbi:MAG: TonB family protein, partial [Gammaproteobacteria bacterium]